MAVKRVTPKPPMLVLRSIHANDLDSKELGAALRFKFGTAEKADFDLLMDLINMMLIAASSDKQREYVLKFIDTRAMPTMVAIKKRYDRTGKLGVSGEEAKVLVDITTVSKDFWDRQPVELYKLCYKELKAYYADIATKRSIENKGEQYAN